MFSSIVSGDLLGVGSGGYGDTDDYTNIPSSSILVSGLYSIWKTLLQNERPVIE